jgi:hypothetical protein
MKSTITISELEEAINRSRRMQPVRSGVLPPDLRIMAEFYGRMIYERRLSVDLEQHPTHVREVVYRWLDAGEGKFPISAELRGQESPDTRPGNVPKPGSFVCAYRPGDPTFDGCEACQ